MREEGWPGREGWYDIAQICLNGHVINTMAKSNPRRVQGCNLNPAV